MYELKKYNKLLLSKSTRIIFLFKKYIYNENIYKIIIYIL